MAELLWKRGRVLGRGGFSVISSASTSNALFNGVILPTLIAIKSCKFTDSDSLKEEVGFLRLFKDSPYIIRCFGANLSFEDGVIFCNLMLEYASGGSLADRIQYYNSGEGLPELEVKKHTKNILLGLSRIHSSGVIHCDIKPGNILLVGDDKTAKIADFGLSMTMVQGMNQRQRLIRGTKRYMAPEAVLDNEYGPQGDIWALGCTVYEQITGTTLWVSDFGSREDADDDDVLEKIGYEEPKFQNSKLSNEAQDFLKKCLIKDPISRWTADMLLNHPFLHTSCKVAKTRKKRSGSISLLYKPIKKITFKHDNHKFVLQLKNIDAVQLQNQKEVENE